jgi:hypothetical protein
MRVSLFIHIKYHACNTISPSRNRKGVKNIYNLPVIVHDNEGKMKNDYTVAQFARNYFNVLKIF